MTGRTTWLARAALVCTLVALGAPSAQADEQTVRLIQLLIAKGILSPGQAKDLLRETGTSARTRRAASRASVSAPAPQETPETPVPGQIRVTYVPQFIREQIADEVRAEVVSQSQEEGIAQPSSLPEWINRIRIYGDLRMRYQGDIFDKSNSNQFVNFNAINNGSPFDIFGYANGTGSPPPFLNTTENRNLYRVRARVGVDVALDDWVTADVRIGTGSDAGPVSPNQTLGQPGDFNKYQLWVDKAYFKLTPLQQVTLFAGRMYNPFLPSDLMFYPDLSFDGVAAVGSQAIDDGLTAFGTAGAFPVSNTAFDFSTTNTTKYASRDAYLAGIQAGLRWNVTPEYQATLGVGLFDFLGVQGAVSSLCNYQQGSTVTNPIYYCNTDNTRPPFLQFGNTVYAIRNLVPVPGTATPPDPQYFGLASKFNVLDIHPRFEIYTYHPIDIAIEAEFIKNLAYSRSDILNHGPRQPGFGGSAIINTVGPQNNIGNNGFYQGGDTGYMAKLIVGKFALHKAWDWNVALSYRYLETDSTLDSIADADFHLGGTNARGYILAGNLGVAANTQLSLRWFSATSISGPRYNNDVVQFDLLSSF